MRAAHRSQAAAAALLVADDSESDYDVAGADQLLAAPYQVGMSVPQRGRTNRSSGLHYKGVTPVAAYYDPKAAEFNQYLLEQQEFGNGHEANELLPGVSSSGGGAVCREASSDDDNDYFGLGTGGTGLTRSRSCMLGPNAGSNSGPSGAGAACSSKQASKFTSSSGAGKKVSGGGAGAGKMGSSSNWESGGRNTIA